MCCVDRARAHEIWESEGRPTGRDREHWERATREIEAEVEGPDHQPSEQNMDQGGADRLQPGGTIPSGGPGAGMGSIGTGGGSTAGKPSGSVRRRSA
ncbi:DUF2934 domain-containing protein [Chelativorans sp. YIM 93263]|uniref:DUF2934 domain-containing protein n=1 Tax=Chelativorans sp. YIM 93263 TaxID=2906648 RepID=UPI0023799422|nr:DUF2934 domain-containing protein [Chelativorans sp. YIM 93263]